MQVNRSGHIAGGNKAAFVDGVNLALPTPNGNPQFLWPDKPETVQQVCIGDVCNVQRADGTVVIGVGANHLYAGGGEACCSGPGGQYYDSRGTHLTDRVPLGMDDGEPWAAITSLPDGIGLWLRHIVTGETIQLEAGQVRPELCMRRGVLLYQLADGTLKRWQSGVTTDLPSLPVRGIQHTGTGIRASWHEALGMVVHHESAALVLPLHPGDTEHDFHPSVAALEDGRVRVVSSHFEGEDPTTLRTYDIDLAAGTVNGEARVWTNPWTVPPPVENVPVPTLVKALAPFRLVITGHPDNPEVDDFDFFDQPALWPTCPSGTKPAVFYFDGYDVPDAMIEDAKAAKKDGRRKEVWLSWHCYPKEGQSSTDTIKAIRNVFDKASATGLPCAPWLRLDRGIKALTPPTYAWTLGLVVGVFAGAWSECVMHRVGWVFIWHWSRGGGLDGIVSSPVLKALASQVQEIQRTTTAPLPPPVTVPPVIDTTPDPPTGNPVSPPVVAPTVKKPSKWLNLIHGLAAALLALLGKKPKKED